MTMPETTPELERFIARHLSGLSTEDWRALSKDDRHPHILKARKLLKLERSFMSRGSEAAAEAEA